MIMRLAGEPSLDNEGNVYFTHHFFKDGKMVEADGFYVDKKWERVATGGLSIYLDRGVGFRLSCVAIVRCLVVCPGLVSFR